MIPVKRRPAPAFFRSVKHQHITRDLHEYFEEFSQAKSQSSYDFGGTQDLQKLVKDDLLDMFNSKCAYCESMLGVTSNGELENFRPQRGARGFGKSGMSDTSDSSYHDTHYWWLAYEWDNLLIACPQCHRFKASWFPIVDESWRALPNQKGPELEAEAPLLLDPCNDSPHEHLYFEESGIVQPLTDRGKVTIDILKLNRTDLVTARIDALVRLKDRFKEIRTAYDVNAKMSSAPLRFTSLEYIYWVLGSNSKLAYRGIQKQFLITWLSDDLDLRVSLIEGLKKQKYKIHLSDFNVPLTKYVTEKVIVTDTIDLRRLVLEKVEIRNFKNIENLTIDVPQTSREGRAPWLVFLGDNAVGKSSILQAIVLTLMGRDDRLNSTGMTPDKVLRYYKEGDKFRQSKEGYVKIWVSGVEAPLELTFSRNKKGFGGNVVSPETYLMAYGPTRLSPAPSKSSNEDVYDVLSLGRVRVCNLFWPSIPLMDANSWLFDLWEIDKDRHDHEDTPYNLIVRGLRSMLLMSEEDSIEPDLDDLESKRILITLKNEITRLDNLSDGYRSIFALAADMMFALQREGTSMEEAEGIVIIDEIGTNLHPGWKKRIVSCFRTVFPRIQFIVTTHEPLCLRGLYDKETVLLRRDYDEKVAAITNLPNPQDLRVDELLASEFFGLSSTLEVDVEDLFEEYYKLLTIKRPKVAQKERIKELKQDLREREHLGHGLRDELMYEVIDKLIAENTRSGQPLNRSDLKKETVEKVLASWKKSGLYDESKA